MSRRDWFGFALAGLGVVVCAATVGTAAVIPGGRWWWNWAMQASAAGEVGPGHRTPASAA